MTLIVACLTPEFVLQVSDRRLVNPLGEPVEETANKTVLFCGHHVFGYTGLARIGDEPTDWWIARTLAVASSLQVALHTVRDTATEVFRRLPYPGPAKRLAVVGVGWARPTRSSPLAPTLTWVTNCAGEHGWLAEAQDAFTVGQEIVPPNALRVISAGQSIEDKRMEQLKRTLRKRLRRGNGAATAAQLIAAEIRHIAAHNTAVGKSLLVSSLPRAAVPANVMLSVDRPAFGKTVTFAYMPGGADDPVAYGPNYACRGVAIAEPMVSGKPLPPRRPLPRN